MQTIIKNINVILMLQHVSLCKNNCTLTNLLNSNLIGPVQSQYKLRIIGNVEMHCDSECA